MKVVFISGMLPSGHFSQIITGGINKHKNIDLIVYADKNPKNLQIKGCGEVRPVWSKSPKFIIEIFNELRKDKPDVVHLQQELNMFGGIATVLLFPLLVLLIKLLGIKLIVTLHASVYKKQINNDFVELFNKNPKVIRPFVLKLLFYWIFIPTSIFADGIIVHTNLSKDILTKDYFVDKNKVTVIRTAIPEKPRDNSSKENYFFYFGYMVRRKGLSFALEGFKKFIEKNPESKWKFILAGGVIKGQEASFEEIKKMVHDSHLENNIEFRGFIEEKEQDELYKNAYAVLIPAKVSMGSSGPLYHACSYGKCVIATREGHFIEDIDDQKTGILTENDKWDEALEFAVNNPKVIKEIEENVIKKAEARSPFNTAAKYIELYKKASK